ATIDGFAKVVIAKVLADADDFDDTVALSRIVDDKLSPDGIGSREIELGHGFVDDSHARRTCGVLRTDAAAHQNRNPDYIELIRSHRIFVRDGILIAFRGVAFDLDVIGAFGSAEQSVFGNGRSRNSRQGAEPLDELSGKGGKLVVLVAGSDQVRTNDKQVLPL